MPSNGDLLRRRPVYEYSWLAFPHRTVLRGLGGGVHLESCHERHLGASRLQLEIGTSDIQRQFLKFQFVGGYSEVKIVFMNIRVVEQGVLSVAAPFALQGLHPMYYITMYTKYLKQPLEDAYATRYHFQGPVNKPLMSRNAKPFQHSFAARVPKHDPPDPCKKTILLVWEDSLPWISGG